MWNTIVTENLAEIRTRIESACARSGRSPEQVLLVAVSKTFPPAAVEAALDAGVTDIGENRVQELREKTDAIGRRARWHLIGHLQSNKAKLAASLADVVQTVDSVAIARRLARESQAEGRALDVLIQVNVGEEPQKSGVAVADAGALAREISQIDGLRLCGLMTIPPLAGEETTRRYFRALRELRERLSGSVSEQIRELSMGMTDDFEIAIEEGATIIRVGRAVFGRREQ
jgi:PLP dependent protein